MANNKWQWKGGRLWLGGTSISVTEAWKLIPKNESIAEACEDVLKPYTRELEYHNAFFVSQLKAEQKAEQKARTAV